MTDVEKAAYMRGRRDAENDLHEENRRVELEGYIRQSLARVNLEDNPASGEIRWRRDWSRPPSHTNPEYRYRGAYDLGLWREVFQHIEEDGRRTFDVGNMRWQLWAAGFEVERVTERGADRIAS